MGRWQGEFVDGGGDVDYSVAGAQEFGEGAVVFVWFLD